MQSYILFLDQHFQSTALGNLVISYKVIRNTQTNICLRSFKSICYGLNCQRETDRHRGKNTDRQKEAGMEKESICWNLNSFGVRFLLEVASLQGWLIKIRLHWSRVSPKSHMTLVITNRRRRQGGRCPCDNKGDTRIRQATPSSSANTERQRRQEEFTSTGFRGKQPCQPPASRTVIESISIVLSHGAFYPSLVNKYTTFQDLVKT